MARIVKVLRDKWFDHQAALGTCFVYDEYGKQLFHGQSLERGWTNNEVGTSCVPEGVYPLKLENSPRFKKDLWELYDVPDRAECKFHVANYFWQLNGCIALGKNRKFIDGDSIMDVTSSRETMELFHAAMAGHTEAIVEIINVINPPIYGRH